MAQVADEFRSRVARNKQAIRNQSVRTVTKRSKLPTQRVYRNNGQNIRVTTSLGTQWGQRYGGYHTTRYRADKVAETTYRESTDPTIPETFVPPTFEELWHKVGLRL